MKNETENKLNDEFPFPVISEYVSVAECWFGPGFAPPFEDGCFQWWKEGNQ